MKKTISGSSHTTQKAPSRREYKPIDTKLEFKSTDQILKILEETGERLLKQEIPYYVASTMNGLVQSAIRIHALPFDELKEAVDRIEELEARIGITEKARLSGSRNSSSTSA